MIDKEEIDRKNFLLWLALTNPLEVLKVKREHPEKFSRMFREYCLEKRKDGSDGNEK